MSTIISDADIHPRWPINFVIISTLFLCGFGLLSFLFALAGVLIGYFQELFVVLSLVSVTLGALLPFLVPLLAQSWLLIVVFISALVVSSILISYAFLRLIRRTAAELIVALSLLLPILLIILGLIPVIIAIILPLMTGYGYIGLLPAFVLLIIPVIGVILLYFTLKLRERIRTGGLMLEFASANVLSEPKGMLSLPVLMSIFTGIFAFFAFWAFFGIQELLYIIVFPILSLIGFFADPSIFALIAFIIAGIFELFYLLIYFTIYYTIQALVMNYAKQWYYFEDPTLGSSIRTVRVVWGTVIVFAFVRALIQLPARLAHRATQREDETHPLIIILLIILFVLNLIISLIWRLLTYFCLPVILFQRKTFKNSIKESAYLIWNNWLDILLTHLGVGLGLGVYNLLFALTFGIAGVATGAVLWVLAGSTNTSVLILAMIILGFGFFIFGFLPFRVLTTPLNIAVHTYLYCFAMDRQEGFQTKSRLPQEIKDFFLETIQDAEEKQLPRSIPDPSTVF
ncbi:MAG: hypothetical protein ACFFCZ_01820 [Promethearchaeota archaeon]